MSVFSQQHSVPAQPLEQELKHYVLDTSVFLADPYACLRFAEHHVVIPIVVINELEKKRNDPELGFLARRALRLLERLREEHGNLALPLMLGDSSLTPETTTGTLVVELNHSDQQILPVGMRSTDNDSRILTVAAQYAATGAVVVLVTKDLPLRLKAAALGITAESYRHEQVPDTGYRGWRTVACSAEAADELYTHGVLDLAQLSNDIAPHSSAAEDAGGQELDQVVGQEPAVLNEGLIIETPSGAGALARSVNNGGVLRAQLVKEKNAFGLCGRSAEQRLALDVLLDESVGIVSLGGKAGTGKSVLALCAGLEEVLERNRRKKITVFRPIYAVGGQELGYLPGSEDEKMAPWRQAIFDALDSVVSQNVIDEIVDRNLLEVLPLTHIRGRSLHDTFVIVDEAQSLEKNVLLSVLSRVGMNSKVVLTHDVAQRDNLRVGRHDGVTAVVEMLKGHQLFAHITLTRAERSPVAALVTHVLDQYGNY